MFGNSLFYSIPNIHLCMFVSIYALVSIYPQNLSSFSDTLSTELLSSLAAASVELYSRVRHIFVKSDTPGRQHYLFSLRHLESALQVINYVTSYNHFILWMDGWMDGLIDGSCIHFIHTVYIHPSFLPSIHSFTQSIHSFIHLLLYNF